MYGDNEREIWRDVAGYEGCYQVSNLGNVKNVRTNKILKANKVVGGYYRVDLSVNNIVKHFKIHRLVANAFLENPNNLPSINHKDENKGNNCADNLEWCTHKYNANYGTSIERRVRNTDYENRKFDYVNRKIDYVSIALKKTRPILQYDKQGNFIKRWSGAKEIANNFNVKASTIRDCARGNQKTSCGFIWRYENERRL